MKGSFRKAATNGGKWLIVTATVCALALSVLAFIGLANYLKPGAPHWAPLSYPYQPYKVEPGVVHLGGTITVTATRCLSEPTDAEAATAWESVTPSGYTYHGEASTLPRPSGCNPIHATVPIPTEVDAICRHLFSLGAVQIQWRLTGYGTPVRADGTRGVTATWTTTIFTVVP